MEKHTVTTPKTTLIYSLILGLLLGVGIVERAINNDPVIVATVYTLFQKIFREQFNADLTGTPTRINLVFPELVLKDVRVKAHDGSNWQWQTKRFSLGFSWLQFLMNKSVHLNVALDKPYCSSGLKDGVPEIADHIQRFIFGKSAVPMSLKGLEIRNGTFHFYDPSGRFESSVQCNVKAGVYGKRYRVQCICSNSSACLMGKDLFVDGAGTIGVDMQTGANEHKEISVDAQFTLPQLTEFKRCTLSLNWLNTKGQCIIHNQNKSFVCAFFNVASQPFHRANYQCFIPLDWLKHYIFPDWLSIFNGGSLWLRGAYTAKKDPALEGELELSGFKSDHTTLKDIAVNYTGEHGLLHGSLSGTDGSQEMLRGSWMYDPKKNKGEGTCYTNRKFQYKAFEVPAHGGTLLLGYNQGVLSGMYQLLAQHKEFEYPLHLQGTFKKLGSNGFIEGIYNDYSYKIEHTDKKTECVINQKSATQVAQIELDENNQLTGTVDFGVIQKILHGASDTYLSGHGLIDLHGTFTNNSIHAQCSMKNASVRLLDTHNVVKEVSAHLEGNLNEKKCILRNVSLVCDKGTVQSNKAVAYLEPLEGVSFLHCPLIINNLFLNSNQDLFTVMTGYLLLSKNRNERPSLSGNLIIERSRLNKNIFAELNKKSLQNLVALPQSPREDLALNILLESRHPVLVATPSIAALIDIKLGIKGTLSHPDVTGSVEVVDGQLLFPYRPLTITKGSMYYLPQQLQDPILELQAKAKVRNYHITMHCTGSLHQPHISFESTPPLTEEQILTLLLAGSEEGSFSVIMPAVVMQRLQHLLFGHSKKASAIGSYLKNILKPLRFIRLVPKFTDQTARGGIRGAIEVDVTDHLRAIIQKNFSITEDTKIEVEYYLSDEVTIRGIKDERSDIGAEVEMRWKF